MNEREQEIEGARRLIVSAIAAAKLAQLKFVVPNLETALGVLEWEVKQLGLADGTDE